MLLKFLLRYTMRKPIKLLIIFLCFWTLNTSAASFDCTKVTSKTEKWICEDAELSRLDEILAQAYKSARDSAADKNAVKLQQIEWIKENIKICTEIACLKSRYKVRLKQLQNSTPDSETNNQPGKWKYIASGDQHTCVASTNEIKCWGNNEYGILDIPRKFNGITQLVSTWSSAVCAKDNQGWECWGACKFGICDIPKEHKKSEKISSGAAHVCSLHNGNVVCWGSNKYERTSVPVGLKNVIDVAVSDRYSCAVTWKGAVKCWGSNKDNQILAAEALENVSSIYLGSRHACAFDQVKKLSCSQVVKEKIGEFPNFGQSLVPENIEFKYVATGRLHTCGVNKNNEIKCWGEDHKGQSTPPKLNASEVVTAVSVGADHSCALTSARVLCWGVYWNDEYTQPLSAKAISEKSLFRK